MRFKSAFLSIFVTTLPFLSFAAEPTQTSTLIVSQMKVSLSGKGATATDDNSILTLEIIPKITRNGANLSPETMRYAARTYLVSVIKEGDKISRTLLGQGMLLEPQSMSGDHLILNIPFSQTYKSSLGQVELALELVPIGTGVQRFDGVFLLGSHQFQNGSVVQVVNEFPRNGSVEEYLKSVAIPNVINLPSSIFAIQPFEFDPVDLASQRQVTEKQDAESRTLSLYFQTIVRNPLENGEPVRSTDFIITLFDGTKIKRRTNQIGILSWVDKVSYNINPRVFHTKVVKIEHQSGFSQSIVTLIDLPASGPAKVIDARVLNAEAYEELMFEQANKTK